MHVKTSYLLALGSAVCLLLTSCVVTSDQPLSSSKTAKPDSRLLGDWHETKDGDTYHFTARKGAWMHVVISHLPTDTRKPEEYDLFPTVLGKETFLNVRMIDKDDKGQPTEAYVFLRYSLSDNHTLQMWMLSEDAVATAVKAGKLKGDIHQNGDLTNPHPIIKPSLDVDLHDSTENILKFIHGSDIKTLFSEKMEPLTRITTGVNKH